MRLLGTAASNVGDRIATIICFIEAGKKYAGKDTVFLLCYAFLDNYEIISAIVYVEV